MPVVLSRQMLDPEHLLPPTPSYPIFDSMDAWTDYMVILWKESKYIQESFDQFKSNWYACFSGALWTLDYGTPHEDTEQGRKVPASSGTLKVVCGYTFSSFNQRNLEYLTQLLHKVSGVSAPIPILQFLFNDFIPDFYVWMNKTNLRVRFSDTDTGLVKIHDQPTFDQLYGPYPFNRSQASVQTEYVGIPIKPDTLTPKEGYFTDNDLEKNSKRVVSSFINTLLNIQWYVDTNDPKEKTRLFKAEDLTNGYRWTNNTMQEYLARGNKRANSLPKATKYFDDNYGKATENPILCNPVYLDIFYTYGKIINSNEPPVKRAVAYAFLRLNRVFFEYMPELKSFTGTKVSHDVKKELTNWGETDSIFEKYNKKVFKDISAINVYAVTKTAPSELVKGHASRLNPNIRDWSKSSNKEIFVLNTIYAAAILMNGSNIAQEGMRKYTWYSTSQQSQKTYMMNMSSDSVWNEIGDPDFKIAVYELMDLFTIEERTDMEYAEETETTLKQQVPTFKSIQPNVNTGPVNPPPPVNPDPQTDKVPITPPDGGTPVKPVILPPKPDSSESEKEFRRELANYGITYDEGYKLLTPAERAAMADDEISGDVLANRVAGRLNPTPPPPTTDNNKPVFTTSQKEIFDTEIHKLGVKPARGWQFLTKDEQQQILNNTADGKTYAERADDRIRQGLSPLTPKDGDNGGDGGDDGLGQGGDTDDESGDNSIDDDDKEANARVAQFTQIVEQQHVPYEEAIGWIEHDDLQALRDGKITPTELAYKVFVNKAAANRPVRPPLLDGKIPKPKPKPVTKDSGSGIIIIGALAAVGAIILFAMK